VSEEISHSKSTITLKNDNKTKQDTAGLTAMQVRVLSIIKIEDYENVIRCGFLEPKNGWEKCSQS